MKRSFIIMAVFFLALPSAFSVPLETLVSDAYAARLRASSDLIIETQLRNPALRLMPGNSELRQYINGIRSTLNPNMMVEALFLYKKPDNFHTPHNNWDSQQKIQVFNQILAISTLTGIQYFSASRNAMRTFYEYSSVVDGPQARNPLPDPVFSQLPNSLTLYARQRDLSFGDNIYRYNYINTPDSVFFDQENITPMNYGIVRAINRNNLRSVIALFDCGDSILIYAISMARAASLPGMGDRIGNSFQNRAGAVLNWLTNRLNSQIFYQ